MLKFTHYSILLLSLSLCSLADVTCGNQANEATTLLQFLRTKRSNSFGQTHNLHELDDEELQFSITIMSQDGLQQLDKIRALPGQPDGAQFAHYSGYVTVDQVARKALFYYFVESPRNSSTNPLLLWLNGGPGCSSFGYGAMAELGPFRVNSDGKTLFQNEYAWNNVANVIFLESPAGVGFSYSNTTANYNQTGDKSTAHDAYTFIVNWLQRFPQYKTRDFYIAGESYAGHYVPQLAYTILVNNNKAKQPTVNLKGIAIGNGLLNDATDFFGRFDYAWTHALISDETYEGIRKNCDFVKKNYPEKCQEFQLKRSNETGVIDNYNIYAPLCHDTATRRDWSNSVQKIDPCIDNYVMAYLNTPEVQKALHVEPTIWSSCSSVIGKWIDSADTVLPVIKQLMDAGIRVWIYSGDIDSVLPVTATRYSINTLELPIQSVWRPWYTKNEIGGYVVKYKGLVFVTVRGAGHMVPSDQPERALTMISSFLEGVLPPSS